MSYANPNLKKREDVFAPYIDYCQLDTINSVHFTPREIDVVSFLINGRSTKKAAIFLCISHKTIDVHIRNIMLKLKVQTQEQIIDFIERSDKYQALKSHYVNLLILFKFESGLRELLTANNQKTNVYLLCDDQTQLYDSIPIKRLCSHIKLTGFNATIEHNLDFLYHSPQQSVVIFLTIEGKISSDIEKLIPKIININIAKNQNYYSFVFNLLNKLLQNIDIEKYALKFKEQCDLLNTNISLSGPATNQSIRKENIVHMTEHLDMNNAYKNNFISLKKVILYTLICAVLASTLTIVFLSWNKNTSLPTTAKNINTNNVNFLPIQIKAGGSVTWNLPRQDHKFIGRERLLEELEKKLHPGINAELNPPELFTVAVLSGLGGVGKTQLALQYAYNSKHFYKLKAWFFAENIDQLKQEYVDFAWALGYRDREPLFENALAYIREWLSKHKDWLLVYDNVNSYDDIKNFLPSMDGGKIILTTRQQNWPNKFKRLNVDVMTEKESIELMQSLLEQKSTNNGDGLGKLVKTLGYLPLALSQAGAYIKQNSIPFNDYLKIYNEQAQEFLSDDTFPEGTNSLPIAAIWNISLEAIANEEDTKNRIPIALNLLSACAYLAPQKISIPLLLSWFKVAYPKLTNHELQLSKLIWQLNKYSMLSKDDDDNIVVHRLVQAVVRYQHRQSSGKKWYYSPLKQKWFNVLLEGVHREFIKKTTVLEDEARQKNLLPHMQSLLQYYKQIWPDSSELKLAPIFNDIGSVFLLIGNPRVAKDYFERSLHALEQNYGKTHIKIGYTLDVLGIALHQMGDAKQALVIHKRSLAIKEKFFGNNHVEVATTLDYLGMDCRALGIFKQAKELHERSLKIKENYYGKDHVEIAYTLDQLGRDYRNLWDSKQAKKLHEHSLKIKEINYGKDHVEVAYTLDQLGSELRYLGNTKEARVLHERSLTIKEAYYGKNHVEVAHTLDQLGLDYMYLHDIKKAKILHELSLSIKAKYYGNEHIELSSTLDNLAKENALLGSIEKSKLLHERSLFIKKLYHGSDHPEVAETYTNLGIIHLKISEMRRAKSLLEMALHIKEHYHGTDNLALVETLVGLGNYYNLSNDRNNAISHLERAFKIRKTYYGQNHDLTLEIKKLLDSTTAKPIID